MTDYARLFAELQELRAENEKLRNRIGDLEYELRGKEVSREEFMKAQEGIREAAKNFSEVLKYLKENKENFKL